MIQLCSLKPLLRGGRILDGIHGNYIRTKSKDGFSRLYEIINGKPVFRRSSLVVASKDAETGEKAISKIVFSPFDKSFNNKGLTSCEKSISRLYNSEGKPLRTDLDEVYRHSPNAGEYYRDGDFSNCRNPYTTCGDVYDAGGISVWKDYTGTDKTMPMIVNADGSKMGGTFSFNSPHYEWGYLEPNDLKKYERLV